LLLIQSLWSIHFSWRFHASQVESVWVLATSLKPLAKPAIRKNESRKCGLKNGAVRHPVRPSSVVVRAAHVVTAMAANQFAVVPGEPMAACGTNLAMVVDMRCVGRRSLIRRPARTTL
jgi:hypothetical protein